MANILVICMLISNIRPVCINFVARVMLKINVFLLQFALKILGILIFFNCMCTIAVVKAAHLCKRCNMQLKSGTRHKWQDCLLKPWITLWCSNLRSRCRWSRESSLHIWNTFTKSFVSLFLCYKHSNNHRSAGIKVYRSDINTAVYRSD